MENIIITSNENKKIILKNNFKLKILSNLKFYTFQELKKKLFFDYDYETIAFIIDKYHVSVSVAKMYLENLYFLKDVNDEKISFLLDLKKNLDDNNFLIYDSDFKDNIKNKKIVVAGYSKFTKEQRLILSELNTNIEFQDELVNHYEPKVYEAKNIDDEVLFVVEEISRLLENNISINNIKVIASQDYENILERYFNFYNIPFNKRNNHSFYSTLIAKEFLDNYDNKLLIENIEDLSKKYKNINDLINIINKSAVILNDKIRKEFIIEDLKNAKIKESVYDRAITITTLDNNFSDDDYVFLLGFNVNLYPKIKRDIDFLSDNVKSKLGLDTSTDYNKYQVDYIINKIYNIRNLTITYKLSGPNGIYYPSILIKKFNIPVKEVYFNNLVSYSKKDCEIKYAIALDNLYKYNIIDDKIALYQNSLSIPYFTYDNQFKGIKKELILNKLNNNLTLSYTNMEMYQECAFHYYVSKILHLDIFLETFKTIIGTVMHHILELGIIKDINIPIEIMKFIKEKGYVLNAKEIFYLEIFSNDLIKILDVIKEQQKHSKLNKYLFESEFYVYKDLKEMKITFKGNIDKVMYENILGKEVIAVVDYKTGNTKINLDGLDFGLHLQLPIYLYLLKKSERFHNSLIAGFYIQKVLPKKENIQFKKSERELLEGNLRLQGFTNSDEKLMELIDDKYQEGKIIQNLQFKKDGSISSKSKVLSSDDMNFIILKVDKIIDDVIKHILDGDFSINPKILEQKNVACKYCKFKDLCYVKKQNEVVLGGEDSELDETTIFSD